MLVFGAQKEEGGAEMGIAHAPGPISLPSQTPPRSPSHTLMKKPQHILHLPCFFPLFRLFSPPSILFTATLTVPRSLEQGMADSKIYGSHRLGTGVRYPVIGSGEMWQTGASWACRDR